MDSGEYNALWRRRQIKLLVAPYNDGGTSWAETEETAFFTYVFEHGFNDSAKCIITLDDPTGVLMRKYNAEDNDVYLGVVKITLEDPTGTDYFYGRIKRVTANSADKTCTLECADWLDQLDDEKITYDMREKLGTTDFRQSEARSDVDNATFVGVAVKETLKAAIADDGGGFSDETTEALSAAANDMDLLPSVLPAVNDAYYFGWSVPQIDFTINVGTAVDATSTQVWEYWDGDSWESLAGISDGTNHWRNAGSRVVSWTMPGDWVANTVNSQGPYYYVRSRCTAYADHVTSPDGTQVTSEKYYFFDDGAYDDDGGMAFSADQYNDMKLFLGTGMAGTKMWTFHPYGSTPAGEDTYGDAVEALWVENATVDSGFAPNDWTLDYHFRVELGHDTPSDFYVHSSITGARVICVHKVTTVGAGNHAHVNIYENDGSSWVELSHLAEGDLFTRATHTIPINRLAHIVDASGELDVQYDIDRVGGNATISLRYLAVELDVTTTGYGTGITINDTFSPNRLEVATDLTAAATQIWEKVPYCISKPSYLHLESATGLILGGDTIVTLTAGAGDIENTTYISTTQFKDKTRLRMIKSLALEDAAVFYITQGGTTVTYKKTFGADTMQLTDSDVKDWQSLHDYNTMFNSYKVYGARIGDYEIYQLSEDAASKTKFLNTKTKVIRNAGLVTDGEAKAMGTGLVAKQHEVEQMVGCTIHGNTPTAGHETTIKLGEVVEITSSYLWPNAAKDYIVSRLVYDSKENETYLTLYPKASTGEPVIEFPDPRLDAVNDRMESDSYVPDPVSHEQA